MLASDRAKNYKTTLCYLAFYLAIYFS